MADQTVLNQTQQLLPEYQETFLKNLLSNIYQVELDDAGNPLLDANGQPIVSGIAAESPLMGIPVFDDAGNPVYERDAQGNIRTDFRGNPIQVVEGGVVPPDVAPFVTNQLEAIRSAEEGVGTFQPFFTDAETTLTGAAGRIPTAAGMFTTGEQGLGGTTGAYDISGYRDYYTPFTTDVIGQTAGDVAQSMRDINTAATTGAAGITGEAAAAQQGIRGAGAGIAGQVGGAQQGVAQAAQAARQAAGTGAAGITGAAGGIAPVVQQAAADVGQAAAGARGAAGTGAAGMRGAAAGIPGVVSGVGADLGQTAAGARGAATGAQTATDIAAQRARMSSAQAQQDLATAGQFGLGAAAQGMQGLAGTTGQFSPSGIGAFMSPYEDAAVQQAIQDIARAGQIQQQNLRAQAVGAGAYGGSREAVAAQELGRNILEQQGRTAAQMRQAGYESAAQRAQQAFEASQSRAQQAAQLTGALGQAGAGSAAQAAQAAGQLGLSAEQLAQTGALQGGQLGLSAEQLAQVGALQGGQLGLSALTNQADIERAAAALGLSAEQLAQTGALQTGQLGISGQTNIGSLLDAASRLGLSAEQLAQTGALQGGQLGLSGQTNLASILQAAGQMGMTAEEAAAQLGMTGAQQQAALSSNLANLRAAGFGSSQELSQGAFENQMARGQTAAQIFGQLGQGLGNLANTESTIGTRQAALGEATQAAQQRDVNALFNIGSLEQAQQQAEYDVQRAADIEQAYEPFQRFSYMSDIFRGVPSTQGTLTATSVPTPSPVSSILGTAQGIAGYQQATGQGILSGLV